MSFAYCEGIYPPDLLLSSPLDSTRLETDPTDPYQSSWWREVVDHTLETEILDSSAHQPVFSFSRFPTVQFGRVCLGGPGPQIVRLAEKGHLRHYTRSCLAVFDGKPLACCGLLPHTSGPRLGPLMEIGVV